MSGQGLAPSFSGAELERYAHHIMLREIGGPGQRRMKAARVLALEAVKHLTGAGRTLAGEMLT